MEKKEKIIKIIGGVTVAGLLAGVIIASRRNRKLSLIVENYKGQIQNQNDVICGLQKVIERNAYSLGKRCSSCSLKGSI